MYVILIFFQIKRQHAYLCKNQPLGNSGLEPDWKHFRNMTQRTGKSIRITSYSGFIGMNSKSKAYILLYYEPRYTIQIKQSTYYHQIVGIATDYVGRIFLDPLKYHKSKIMDGIPYPYHIDRYLMDFVTSSVVHKSFPFRRLFQSNSWNSLPSTTAASKYT